ncbi:hypothetical protein MGYG_00453 [Nannizzia gypsea CBS 118893]|uniref:Prenyltransferase n=1 Tax=Arthroderma gypseum (strain ATCC MYA-4604 / CBS 118893) TaxID=535722 RepID=E5QZV0_ARTGP|nr:hypothetical protein MGYG_00453 [Nannizzia gypsea CBS 118893]EFQ97413.1 hypothetical protein MGYG_00453 [Nannizzia gypsea CBS 118893]
MSILSRLQLLTRASRPAYWTTALTLYLIGHLQSGRYPQTVPEIMLGVAFSAPFSLVIQGGGDIHDYDSDIKNPRKGQDWLDGRSIEKADHAFVLLACRVATFGIILLAVPAAIQTPQVMGYVLLCLGTSWAYTTPPIRLKGRPLLDSLSSGTLYWSIWASGYHLRGDQTNYGIQNSNSGAWTFCFCIGLQMFAAALDQKADSAAGIRSIATAYGERPTAFFSATFL